MNHALPPTRDVPSRRQAQIRARLEQEVTGGRRAVRFAPLIAAGVAAAAVVTLVAVVAPWQQAGGDDGAAGATSQAGVTSQAEVTTTAGPPVMPKLSPERIAEIEQGCAAADSGDIIEGKLVLRQYLTDEAGTFALLYSDQDVLACAVDGPTAPYSVMMAGRPAIGWLPGEFVPDYAIAVSGGDGSKPENGGLPGYVMAAGRVTSKVARVTFGPNGQEVEATITDSTFVARITHPSDWLPPVEWERQNALRAYDANGVLLGEWDTMSHRTKCWMNPAGEIVAGARDIDPARCAPAVPWK